MLDFMIHGLLLFLGVLILVGIIVVVADLVEEWRNGQ